MPVTTTNTTQTQGIQTKTADENKIKRKPSGELGKNEFMVLLAAQLKYQDPLKPMDDKAFIGQLAQFSALEQMLNVSLAANLNLGIGVMGHTVTGVDAEGRQVQGIVKSVRVSEGKPIVKVQPLRPDSDPVEIGMEKLTQID